MDKRFRVLFAGVCIFACAVLAIAVGCGDSSGIVKLRVEGGRVDYGETGLAVLLDVDNAAGYEWTYQQDGAALKPVADYAATDLTTDLAGDGGVVVFSFEGEESGKASLTFSCARSGEDPVKTLALDVFMEGGFVKRVVEQV